jgi:hypothetical protein
VLLAGGQRVEATRFASYDQSADLVVLELPDPKSGYAVAEIADAEPDRGAAVEAAGYGPGNYASIAGRVAELDAANIRVTGAARDGDSGGPIFCGGRVVGVCYGTSNNIRYGVALPRVRAFLRAMRPPWGILWHKRPVTFARPGVAVPSPIVQPSPVRVIPGVPVPPPQFTPPRVADATPIEPPASGTLDVPTPQPAFNERDIAAMQQQVATLSGQVAELKRPLTVQIVDTKGTVLQQTQTGLGGTLRFRLVPVEQKAKAN